MTAVSLWRRLGFALGALAAQTTLADDMSDMRVALRNFSRGQVAVATDEFPPGAPGYLRMKEHLDFEDGAVKPLRTGSEVAYYNALKQRIRALRPGERIGRAEMLALGLRSAEPRNGKVHLPEVYLTIHNVVRLLARPEQWNGPKLPGDYGHPDYDPANPILQDVLGRASSDGGPSLADHFKVRRKPDGEILYRSYSVETLFGRDGGVFQYYDGAPSGHINGGAHYYFWVGALGRRYFTSVGVFVARGKEYVLKKWTNEASRGAYQLDHFVRGAQVAGVLSADLEVAASPQSAAAREVEATLDADEQSRLLAARIAALRARIAAHNLAVDAFNAIDLGAETRRARAAAAEYNAFLQQFEQLMRVNVVDFSHADIRARASQLDAAVSRYQKVLGAMVKSASKASEEGAAICERAQRAGTEPRPAPETVSEWIMASDKSLGRASAELAVEARLLEEQRARVVEVAQVLRDDLARLEPNGRAWRQVVVPAVDAQTQGPLQEIKAMEARLAEYGVRRAVLVQSQVRLSIEVGNLQAQAQLAAKRAAGTGAAATLGALVAEIQGLRGSIAAPASQKYAAFADALHIDTAGSGDSQRLNTAYVRATEETVAIARGALDGAEGTEVAGDFAMRDLPASLQQVQQCLAALKASGAPADALAALDAALADCDEQRAESLISKERIADPALLARFEVLRKDVDRIRDSVARSDEAEAQCRYADAQRFAGDALKALQCPRGRERIAKYIGGLDSLRRENEAAEASYRQADQFYRQRRYAEARQALLAALKNAHCAKLIGNVRAGLRAVDEKTGGSGPGPQAGELPCAPPRVPGLSRSTGQPACVCPGDLMWSERRQICATLGELTRDQRQRIGEAIGGVPGQRR